MLKFWDKTDIPRPGSFAGEEEWITDLIRSIALTIANEYLREIKKRNLQKIVDEENKKKQQKIDKLKARPASDKMHHKGTRLDRLKDKTVSLDTSKMKSSDYYFFRDFKGIIESITLSEDGDIYINFPGIFDLYPGFIEQCIQDALLDWEMAYDYTQSNWEESEWEVV